MTESRRFSKPVQFSPPPKGEKARRESAGAYLPVLPIPARRESAGMARKIAWRQHANG
jgi:hypothetical protein